MKDYLKAAGQIALGVLAGCVMSEVVDKVVDVAKKAVNAKKGKSHN